MTVEEVVNHVDEGRTVFKGKGGRTRVVRNAGMAFVEYYLPDHPRAIETTFADEFAAWAIAVK